MTIGSGFQWMARAGYTARAAVFFLVSGLALFSGLSGGGSDTRSAVEALLDQPFGRIWVGMIALGLAGFVIWRFAQSIGNADRQKRNARGLAIRTALFGSAVVYVGLAYYAFERAAGQAAEQGGGERGLAEWAMSQPFGRYLAAAIGLGLVAGGIVTAAKGLLRKYEKYMSPAVADSSAMTFACMYGLAARGLLFMIVGGLFLYAALTVAPEKAGSVGDALNWIRGLPFGGVLYSLTALGLASFGAYNLIEARYRVVHAADIERSVARAARVSAEVIRR
jgi:hypothetical protein